MPIRARRDPELGESLRAWRWKRGWSQRVLAEKLGVYERTVGFWEDGHIPDHRIPDIARAFGLMEEELRRGPRSVSEDVVLQEVRSTNREVRELREQFQEFCTLVTAAVRPG